MTRRRLLTIVMGGCTAWLVLAGNAWAGITLPAVIGDHMVLQRDIPVPIWGWADAGEEVAVELAGQTVTTNVGADGAWRVALAPLPAGGPHTMTIRSEDGSITVNDILVGEVWVCSGQSNMQMAVRECNRAEQEIAQADDSQLRLFTVPRQTASKPQKDIESGEWTACTSKSVRNFSAVAYFFGRSLRQHVGVPVGLIHTSWGGTRIEAWTSLEALATEPMAGPILDAHAQTMARVDRQLDRYENAFAKWRREAAAAYEAGDPVPDPPKMPADPRASQHQPAVLYNAMIAPLVPYGIRGAIWYQGESNAGRAYQYRALHPLMIRDWRQHWGQGDFPFLFVQLANYQAPPEQPVDDAWAELREAQLMTLALPNTGMAVIIDIGDADNIHPTNKQDVGDRLARIARASIYGQDVVYSGPLYRSMKVEGSKIRLSFDHVDGGLASRGGGPLTGFAIAGEDRQFVWADAVIDGETVVVHSDKVAKPAAVRYAWAINPVCNLINKAGLPASPFRTDDWPGITIDER